MKLRFRLLALLISIPLFGCSLSRNSATPFATTPDPTSTAPGLLTAEVTSSASRLENISRAAPPTATSTPTPGDDSSNTPVCRVRSAWATYTVVSGDTLTSIARRAGTPVDDLVRANCLTDANSIQVGQVLYVPVEIQTAAITAPESSDSQSSVSQSNTTTSDGGQPSFADPGCTYPWFVDLAQSEPCPDSAVQTTQAAYQPFEHGFMVWHEGKIWAFYDSGGGITIIDSYDGSEDRPYEDPPPGLYHPQRGFGKIWVELDLLRSALGWATAPEEGYTMRVQSAPVSRAAPGGNVMRSSGERLYTFTLPGNRAMTAILVSTQISSWSRPVVR